MELSKEVHGLLERIKKLSQQVQKNENFSPSNNHKNYTDVSFNADELIPVENMDFSDDERWLYVSEKSIPFEGDLQEWLRQDFNVDNSVTQFLEFESKLEKRFIDTRTFTRPKKRISRPSLEQFADYSSKLTESITSISEESSFSGPVHFKLSEPVFNTSFDRILATAHDSIDSFTNMSPPSLVNSLCSTSFTTLMDSGYGNQEVPNEVINETHDSNEEKTEISSTNLNDTYKVNENDLNSTFQKSKNLSNTSTFTKKPKNSNSFKASCPDINKTFQKNHDCSLDLTFQKLSDSQPNLTEDLKRTILNQSMELMNPINEIYHSARSGSADSLDERSSSISNSSKDSGKILNVLELDTLSKVQEQKMQQAMSTPIKPLNHRMLLESDILSPIQSRVDSEDNLSPSDSDMSDSCVTARSGISKRSSPARSITSELGNITRCLPNKPEVRPLTNLPTMIVKPMEVNRTMIQLNRVQSAPSSNIVRPKIRSSGLPRPTISTSIPRPMSRIPGPKSIRPATSRPIQRQPKTDWMDGCY